MASKEMAYFNVGNDEFEIVDDAGRQATSAVDEKVDAVDEKVDGLSASNLPYSSTQSTKQAIDGKGDNGYYPSLNITNNQGGTESNKAVLITCGNIGQCEMAWVCQNASSEVLTVALPTGWSFYRNGCFLARDVTNGVHVSVWSSSDGQVATYAHIGTMAVGHLYKLVLPAYKTT